MKLKLIAAALAFAAAGSAHALTTSSVGNDSSLFLYVFEDRGLNTTATNSAVFDLGEVLNFDFTANQTISFAASAAWTSYIDTIANSANIKWGIAGAYGSGSTNGDDFYTTLSTLPATFTGSNLSSATVNMTTVMGVYNTAGCSSAASCGLGAVTTNDAASSKWGNKAGGASTTWITTAGLDGSMAFYMYSQNGTKAAAPRTDFMFDGDADTFSLSSNGVLTYTAYEVAAVPEPETYALMLAGLGLVGFMARRRAV